MLLTVDLCIEYAAEAVEEALSATAFVFQYVHTTNGTSTSIRTIYPLQLGQVYVGCVTHTESDRSLHRTVSSS